MRISWRLLLSGLAVTTALIIFIFSVASKEETFDLDSQILKEVQPVPNNIYWSDNGGSIVSIPGETVFSETELAALTPRNVDRSKTGFVNFWYTKEGGAVASTLGSDLNHHFVQGYLSEYMPFYTDELWVPHYVIAMRKQYTYDEAQYNGFVEIWQNSMEAYSNARGDCEDHSMILCDWLISLGYEARVAAGTHGRSGHAWVVLYLDDKAFILEATKKEHLKHNRHYPLAELLPEYQPYFMFDQDFYYEPKSPDSISHRKDQWIKRSILKRNKPLS